jgi:hypothetical protein
MRPIIIVALLFVPASAFAQAYPCAPPASSLLRFDPYKPSHLAIVRNYGGTALAHAPLDALMRLDPYVPTQGALLRQLGGSIPVWGYGAYPVAPMNAWMPPPPPGAPCEQVRAPIAPPRATTPVLTTFSDVLTRLERRPPAAPRPALPTTEERTRGISVQFDGRVWASAGPAVPFSATQFDRVGEQAGSPIFRRTGGDAAVIFVPTTSGMVAPFKAVR